MTPTSILITGGSGFLGGAIVRRLASAQAFRLTVPLRATCDGLPKNVTAVKIPGLDGQTRWETLHDVDVVVHAAARVHVMKEQAEDAVDAFRRVNVEGTLNLARQAADAGVKRFVFISSIKVNGEMTSPGSPYTAEDVPMPSDPYGVSKLEAEQGLIALAKATGMEVVIIRPVLVYGPGVKANFLSMMRWLYSGTPLPFGSVRNRRSLIYLDNLVDLVVTCLDHPSAANQVFLASDGDDVSTSELLYKLSRYLGRSVCLLPIPVWMMSAVATLLGKKALAQRLFGSLQVDISKNQKLLNWTPPVSFDHGLSLTAQHYLESRKL